MSQETLHALAECWLAAKRSEDSAREDRVCIEEEIIALTGCREEGSQTHDAGDWKITVTGKLTRKLDADAWARIEPIIPEAMRPVKYVPTLDITGLRYLENNEPDIYRLVAKAIETKPAKPAVSIK